VKIYDCDIHSRVVKIKTAEPNSSGVERCRRDDRVIDSESDLLAA
jgi:hypothetical protein